MNRFRTHGWVVLAVLWWLSILVLLPLGRGVVDAMRSRGLLVVGVTGGIGLFFVAVVALGVWLQRTGRLGRAQWLIVLGCAGTAILLVQWMPRAEERWHVVQYGVLGVLCWLALPNAWPRRLLIACLLAATAGWLDEGIQLVLPDRVYDWWDVGLNAVSGVAGAGIGEATRWAARFEAPS